METINKEIYFLKGAVQNYDWGGYDYIPELLKIEKETNIPVAEYWLGTHHRGEGKIFNGLEWKSLKAQFDIPYLLKILDVRKMLSIQTHPNKQQAELGFENEERIGIAVTAKNRTFKDKNHKPELMLALTDFWLLHGFKKLESIKECINAIPEFEILKDKCSSTKALYEYVMTLNKTDLDQILNPLKTRLSFLEIQDKKDPNFWAKLAFEDYGNDKGIFSIYFFNLVNIPKGKAIFQEAGIPHAYLQGKNVEVMANSDNVIRAGLTPKHIAIELLLSHLNFEGIEPQIIHPQNLNSFETQFQSPSKEFELRCIRLNFEKARSTFLTSFSNEVYFVLNGTLSVLHNNIEYLYQKGESFFIPSNTAFQLKTNNEAEIVRVVVPE